jgi:hypothetical protein
MVGMMDEETDEFTQKLQEKQKELSEDPAYLGELAFSDSNRVVSLHLFSEGERTAEQYAKLKPWLPKNILAIDFRRKGSKEIINYGHCMADEASKNITEIVILETALQGSPPTAPQS